MNITERVAYLQGLAEGMDISATTKEGKLLLAMVDVISDMAEEITGLGEENDELCELMDIIDEDLGALEGDFYGDDDDDDDDDDDALYEVSCPKCGELIYLDEDLLQVGEMVCPYCKEPIEFDMDSCDCDCDCDCDDECDCSK